MYPPIGYGASMVNNPFSFLSKIKWSSILSGTQKALNFANQAIPLYYNVKPIFKNIKTITKIKKEFINTNNKVIKEEKHATNNNITNPNFFI